MDVEEVTTELYGLPPTEFVAARNAQVARARKEKDADAARRIAALRRPTLAVWAVNLLARDEPEQTGRLLALGETLREATRTLDAAQLREASGQQNRVLAALARRAAALAGEAGHPVGGAVLGEVEQILRTVLADADVAEQWAAGRLTEAPEPVFGFGAVIPEAPVPPSRPAAAPPRADKAKDTKEGRGAEKERQRQRERERQREERERERQRQREGERERERQREAERQRERQRRLERARERAAKAEEEAHAREEAARTAEEAAEAAAQRAEEADAHVTDLERRLAEARRSREDALASADTARHEADAARDAADEARRAADEASDAVRGLAESTDPA
ncbi:hypothetical protein [Streptomyces sp. NPDC126499]|uniref:hypothetical protein n=1 Tax=Streptomyces sp. NPDC126499 TaxID=3155314 RepID=UPI003324D1AB